MGTQIFYTIPEVAEMLKLSEDHIYKVTASGELGSFKIGRVKRITQEQLDKWLESKRRYTKYERTQIADTYIATH
jgi:excisionase family DNA binding protein